MKNNTNKNNAGSVIKNSAYDQILKQINRLESQAEYYHRLLFQELEKLHAAGKYQEFLKVIRKNLKK